MPENSLRIGIGPVKPSDGEQIRVGVVALPVMRLTMYRMEKGGDIRYQVVDHALEFGRVDTEGDRRQIDQEVTRYDLARNFPVIVIKRADAGTFQPALKASGTVPDLSVPDHDTLNVMAA
jgi:hypothetical protein